MKPSTILVAVVLSNVSFCVSSQTISERAERDETIHMSNEEPAMREAFSKARSTLDEFLVRAQSPSPGTTGYALKVAVSDGPNVEYFWVRDFSSEGSSFRGVLNNIPRRVMKHKLGDSIAFHREQIADWTFIDSSKNRMFGNFTACALLSKEPPLQAEKFKQQYGLRCD